MHHVDVIVYREKYNILDDSFCYGKHAKHGGRGGCSSSSKSEVCIIEEIQGVAPLLTSKVASLKMKGLGSIHGMY